MKVATVEEMRKQEFEARVKDIKEMLEAQGAWPDEAGSGTAEN